MAEQATENLDSQNETIEQIEKTNTEVAETKDVEKLIEQNKKLFERAKKAEGTVKELKAKVPETPEKPQSSVTQDTPEDRVLELVGKVPEHLKAEMAPMAKYAKEHNIPVDDVIALFNVKKGFTVPKAELDQFNSANEAARTSGTGGNANPAVRNDETSLKSLSDKDLEAKVKDQASQGLI